MPDTSSASPPEASPESKIPTATATAKAKATNTNTSTSAPTTATTVDLAQLTRAVERSGKFAWLGRAASYPLRHGWLDVEHVGRENVAPHGPVVLAANHLAFIDSLLVMYSLDRPVAFLGKAEYLEHRVARHVFPATGMLPLDRTGRRARVTMNRAHQILTDGGIVGVHPEGTRSRDGVLNPGHQGVAAMALRSNASVVPVALIGTDLVQPVGTRVPQFRGKIEIRYGAPIGLGPWAGYRRSMRARAELTEEIMASIAALSGQPRRVAPAAPAVSRS